MPLIKSKSKKAFNKNVAKEVDAGKPVKQAVAIAYSVKRKAGKKKKKAKKAMQPGDMFNKFQAKKKKMMKKK